MRHTDTKWTRQAEELPLHRVVDMALYMAKILFDTPQGGTVTLPTGTLSHQTSDITITPEPHTRGETASYNAAIAKNLPDLQGRFNVLAGSPQRSEKRRGRYSQPPSMNPLRWWQNRARKRRTEALLASAAGRWCSFDFHACPSGHGGAKCGCCPCRAIAAELRWPLVPSWLGP